MKVKYLKEILNDYKDDAEVVYVDWSSGRKLDIAVGSDDDDDEKRYCCISLV